MPTATPKFDPIKLDNFKKLNLDPFNLANLKPVVLSDLEIFKKLDVRPGLAITSLTLTPAKPRSDKSYLTMHSVIMYMANPLTSNNIALFSSAFPTVNNPVVQVEFDQIKVGKKHLIEFNITLNEPNKIYRFRVFQYPTGTHQDIAISGSQVISVVVPSIADHASTYGASINQLNTKAEACGWIFHSLKISSID